jgi:hypothetical protein
MNTADIAQLRAEVEHTLMRLTGSIEEEKFRAFKKAQDAKPPVMLYPQIGAKYVDVRTRFCAEFGFKSRPTICRYTDADADDWNIAAEDGEYPFEHMVTIGATVGLYDKTTHEIWLHRKLAPKELVTTLGHEYAHYLGLDDESYCEAFGAYIAERMARDLAVYFEESI